MYERHDGGLRFSCARLTRTRRSTEPEGHFEASSVNGAVQSSRSATW